MTPPALPSVVQWCVNPACARCRAALLYVPTTLGLPADCPSCGQAAQPVPTEGCPNPFCGYGADISPTGYCPSCCLTFAEAWDMRGAGSATPCYCGDPRDEHARGIGACLMVRDGVRCGCSRFENPATSGSSVPVHLLPMTAAEPPWQWPTADEEPEPLPGPDPDLTDVTLDDVVTELRDALGTGLPRPDGGMYPGHLQEIEDTLGRIETLLVCSRPSLLLTAMRCALVLVTACSIITFIWMLVGASTLAGVLP